MTVGIADHHYSLMEGLAGDLVFISEMLYDDFNRAKFPGYEIVL